MEIKDTLRKPYTEHQRLDFIVINNYNKGYDIRETNSALEAWGYTQEEEAAKEKEKQIAVLKQQLSVLDEKSARSMRAILAETATADDRAYLANLEAQAEDLRRQIHELEVEQ